MDKTFYVYMLASTRYGTLYVGVTSDLIKRVWEHREGVVEGFTKEYGVKQLVWYETHTDACLPSRAKSRSGNGIGRGRST